MSQKSDSSPSDQQTSPTHSVRSRPKQVTHNESDISDIPASDVQPFPDLQTTKQDETSINLDQLKFTEKDETYQRSQGNSPTDFGRLVHPAMLSASFGNSPMCKSQSGLSEQKPLLNKSEWFKKYSKLALSKLALPIIFTTVIALMFLVMYLADWRKNNAEQFTTKTAIFIFVFIIMMFVLLLEIWHAGIVIMTAVAILLYFRVITTSQAFAGFSDSGTMTVLCVCIISDAINRTGGLALLCSYILPNTEQKWIFPTAIRFVFLFFVASIFLNNTPIVAMGISIVLGLSKTTKIPASKLLMPMQIAVVLGGMCSLIGTSTNMVAKGLLDDATKKLNAQGTVNLEYSMTLFEVGYVALPIGVLGCVYIIFVNKFLLPSNVKTEVKQALHTFIVPVNIVDRSPLIGKEIMKSDLGKLSGVALPQILRGNKMIDPSVPLAVGDTLFYVCEPPLLVELMNIKGLKFEDPTACNILRSITTDKLSLYEVNFTESSEFNNRNFPSYFEDSKFGLLGISHDDKNMGLVKEQPLYFMPVTTNSSYIIITEKNFTKSEFYPHPFRIAYELPVKLPFHYPLWKAMIAITLLLTPIALDVAGFYKIINFSFISVALLVLTGVMTVQQVYNSVNVPLICTLGASFGLSSAMTNTNTGMLIASTLTKLLSPIGKIGILFGLAVPTVVLTQVLSNNATIAVMFPIVWSTYIGSDTTGATRGKEIGIRSSMITMMICASCCFFLPFGYQTNLMVMKDGGYQVKHFMIYGTFLTLLYLVGSVLLSYAIFEIAMDPV
ncbi:sodium/sulfate transporter, putative [Entamoeba invadens IP1]|uniref:Sodium/sulfate transporter, putative n=1 Tax=Entamoeba invadens IP1 TaxID=370355 RepID=A0A0A1UFV8_ENTIV|nr:sodium/sulfate transporter, putative [Entamoeba invadens IP1]ELP91959.1 sodium/sulfate transporter, putative [Entamoeba invadens IP1]|eukprot:XP_004258730.1 sodium/sulfate transporter, putative [Entamoeba invadens IP1]